MILRSSKRVCACTDGEAAPEQGIEPALSNRDEFLVLFTKKYLFSNADNRTHKLFNKRANQKWQDIIDRMVTIFMDDENNVPQHSDTILRGSVSKRTGIVLNRDFDIYIVFESPIKAPIYRNNEYHLGKGYEAQTVLRKLAEAAHAVKKQLSIIKHVACTPPAISLSGQLTINKNPITLSMDILPAFPFDDKNYLVPTWGKSNTWCVTNTGTEEDEIKDLVGKYSEQCILYPLRFLRFLKAMQDWRIPSCIFDHILLEIYDSKLNPNCFTTAIRLVIEKLANGVQTKRINHRYNSSNLLVGISSDNLKLLGESLRTVLSWFDCAWGDDNGFKMLTQDYEGCFLPDPPRAPSTSKKRGRSDELPDCESKRGRRSKK